MLPSTTRRDGAGDDIMTVRQKLPRRPTKPCWSSQTDPRYHASRRGPQPLTNQRPRASGRPDGGSDRSMRPARHRPARDRRKQLTIRQPRHSKEEFARRGTEIYDRDIRPNFPTGSEGKIAAIDIETGAYEIGE